MPASASRSSTGKPKSNLFRDQADARKKELAIEYVRRVGFGIKHEALWPDNYFPEVEPVLVKMASELKPCSLLLSGEIGVGKTAFMAILAKINFMRYCNTVAISAKVAPAMLAISTSYVTHKELVAMLHAMIDRDTDLPFSFESLKNCRLLILDELGSVADSDYTLDYLSELINHRWQFGLTTWMTSNDSPKSLKTRSGWERIAGRLEDHRWLTYAELPGENRRKQ